MRVVILSGSPRKESNTYRVALFLEKLLAVKDSIDPEIVDVRDWQMPLLQSVYTIKEDCPEQFVPLFEKLAAADCFIFLSPEYNGSYSPALKNLIDHFAKGPFSKKAVGIVTASPGIMGGMRAAQQMLQLVPALFAIASPQLLVVPKLEEKFDEAGQLIDNGFQKSVDTFIDSFLWLAKTLKG